MSKSTFMCGVLPLTNRIFAGNVKGNMWSGNKHDVTDSAVSSVAQHLLAAEECLQFKTNGKTYVLQVVEVNESINP